ncbi:hypothetical protein NK944_23885, partial [Salmonella enterica subsp. enterica serovar Typhimurium]
FDSFNLASKSGIQMKLVPERLRGEIAKFDIVDASGKVVVAKDKRITAKHIRELAESGTESIAVPEDFLVGRVIATAVVDQDS